MNNSFLRFLYILHAEILSSSTVPQNMIVFGDTVFKDVIKLKWDH